nr:Dihydrofolate reductase [uncultured bacterium]
MKVFIIAALSADGYIGIDASHRATSWTTKADLQFFVRKTKEAGTIVMGRKTFETIGRPLNDRRLIVLTSKPEDITIEDVEATSESPAELVARLEREGVTTLAVCGGSSIYTQFMEAGLAEELFITVMPKIFGQGLPLFGRQLDINLRLQHTEQLGENTVLLHYKTV